MAKVTCIPAATAAGGAVEASAEPVAKANSAPIADAPVMSPRLRDRLSIPEMTPRSPTSTSSMTVVLFAAWKSA